MPTSLTSYRYAKHFYFSTNNCSFSTRKSECDTFISLYRLIRLISVHVLPKIMSLEVL